MTWVAALFCGVPAAIFTTVLSHGKRDGEIMHKTCVLFFDHNHVRTTLVSFKILLCIVWGFVPVCVMTWFYSFFYKKLKQAAYKKRSRTLTFICILLISFLMLQTPYVTIALFDAYALLTWPLDCEHISHREAIVTLSKVVPNIHCVINPILYAFLGNDFYNKLKHFFRGNLFSRRAFALAQQSMNSDKAWTRTGRSGGSTLAKEITYRQK
uniref:Envelope glycoprotein UL33 n=1 Tax=Cardioderma bat herpesvirus TaxID=3141914 RepID=A0AAU7E1T0_9VIRU